MNNEEKMLNLMETMYTEFSKKFEAMDQRFEAMDQRFEVMDQRFEAIDQRFDAIDRRFDAIDRRFESLENQVKENTQAIANIEATMNEKFGALFDWQKLSQQKFEELDEKIDKLQVSVNEISMKTTYNDSRIIELTRNLKNAK